MRLHNRVTIITGASSGIGRATALALAAEGSAVTLAARRPALLAATVKGISATGGTGLWLETDVADPGQVERLVRTVLERFHRIDILVNSAGFNVQKRSLAALSTDDWRQALNVNLTASFLCTRAVLPVMRAKKGGTIVNIASVAGLQPNIISGPSYCASKAGLIALTRSTNLEERRYGIRACAICPGEVDTPILDRRTIPPSPADRALMLSPRISPPRWPS